jgi:FKBP-type peptidyl-prolyl cis-trans isomerase 2
MAITDGDTVTLEYVGRLDDGTVFDTSRESVATEHDLEGAEARDYQPLTVEIGGGRIIEGLEDGLRGMEAGDDATIEVAPEDGYGEYSEERVVEYDADEFAGMLGGEDPVEGMTVQTEEGLPGEIVSVGPETVEVDFNHDLAGEDLAFEVEVVSVD